MVKRFRVRFLWIRSDNRKSKACPEPGRIAKSPTHFTFLILDRAADQVRAGDQLEERKTNQTDYSAERSRESGSGDQMTVSGEQSAVGSKNKEIA